MLACHHSCSLCGTMLGWGWWGQPPWASLRKWDMGFLASQIPPTLFLKILSVPFSAWPWEWMQGRDHVECGPYISEHSPIPNTLTSFPSLEGIVRVGKRNFSWHFNISPGLTDMDIYWKNLHLLDHSLIEHLGGFQCLMTNQMVGEFKKVAEDAPLTLCLHPLLAPSALRDSAEGLWAPGPCMWRKVGLLPLGSHSVLTAPAALPGLRVCFAGECGQSCGICFSALVLVYTRASVLPSGVPLLAILGFFLRGRKGLGGGLWLLRHTFQPQATSAISRVYFLNIMFNFKVTCTEYVISLENREKQKKQMEKIKVTPNSTTQKITTSNSIWERTWLILFTSVTLRPWHVISAQ